MRNRLIENWPIKLVLIAFYLAYFFLAAWGLDIVQNIKLPWYGIGGMISVFLLIVAMLVIVTISIFDD